MPDIPTQTEKIRGQFLTDNMEGGRGLEEFKQEEHTVVENLKT